MENVIRLYSHSGLCNRLRLFSSYRERSKLEGKPIEMYWIESVQCWKKFSDLFHPVPDVDFVYKKHGKNMRKTRPKNSSISLCPISDEQYNRFLLDIKPLPHIQAEVDRVSRNADHNFGACHVKTHRYNYHTKKVRQNAPYRPRTSLILLRKISLLKWCWPQIIKRHKIHLKRNGETK